jgi:hypothetical protein
MAAGLTISRVLTTIILYIFQHTLTNQHQCLAWNPTNKKTTRDDTRKTFRNTKKIKRENIFKQPLHTFHPDFDLFKTILSNKRITNSNKNNIRHNNHVKSKSYEHTRAKIQYKYSKKIPTIIKSIMPRFKKTQPQEKPYKKVNKEDKEDTTLKVWHPGSIPTETVIERIITFFKKRIESFNEVSLEFTTTRLQTKKERNKDDTSIVVTDYLLMIKTKKYLIDLISASHL